MLDRLIDYVMSGAINWDAITAVATVLYAILVLITLYYIKRQFTATEQNRKLQVALIVFRELGAPEVRRSRRYIYTQVPRNVTGINDTELQRHLMNAEEALIAFDRVGVSL